MSAHNNEIFRRRWFFKEALKRTLGVKDMSSYTPITFGVESYMGISRTHWPEWEGWKFIGERNHKEMLKISVEHFYHYNFWDRIKGDDVASFSPEVAYELFDTAVELNTSDAVRILQIALNKFNKEVPTLKLNGRAGSLTIKSLSLYLDVQLMDKEQSLLNYMRRLRDGGIV